MFSRNRSPANQDRIALSAQHSTLVGLLAYPGRFLKNVLTESSYPLVAPNSIYPVTRLALVEPMI